MLTKPPSAQAQVPLQHTPFFFPHVEKGRSTLDQLSGEARAAVEAKIRELYTEDVTFYEWNRRLRNRDGSAPDGVGCT